MGKSSRYIAVFFIILIIIMTAGSCNDNDRQQDMGFVDGDVQSGSSNESLYDGYGEPADESEENYSKKTYIEDETGKVISTKTDLEVDDNYKIMNPVTGDNGTVPLSQQGLEKSERRATEASKYNFDQNPLINRDRQ